MPKVGDGTPCWREALFARMYRNAGTAAEFSGLPPTQLEALGKRVTL